MRILDKYILKELSGPFMFGVVAFSSVFVGTSVLFRIAQYITQYGASITSAIKLFFYSLPSIIVLTFPMSILLASLMSFGRLSAAGEITAMKSGGVSFYRLAMPVFIVAFLISLLTVVINEKVVPAANSAYSYTVRYEIEKNTKPKSQEHIVIKEISGGKMERLVYARSFDQHTNTMDNVTVQEFENDKLVRVQNSQKAVWKEDQWVMYNGSVNDFSSSSPTEGRIERALKFEEQIMPVKRNPASISMEQKKLTEMTIPELKQHIKILEMQKVPTGVYEVELHQRLSIPMACFIFSFIGVPLGLAKNRSSSSIGFGISVIVIFIYYAIMAIFAAFGQGSAIPAVLAAWMPNIVAISAGIYLMRQAAE